MKIDFYNTHPDAKTPEKNHKELLTGDAGFDLFSVEKIVIPAKSSAIVSVGLKLAYISPGFWFRIESRSGHAFKKGIEVFNGIIDNGYRGELGIKLVNHSHEEQTIEKGLAVCQMIVFRMIDTQITLKSLPIEEEEKVEAKSSKKIRGTKGFGSSDKKE